MFFGTPSGRTHRMQSRIVIVAENPFLGSVVALALAGLGAEIACVGDRAGWQRCCEAGRVDVAIFLRAVELLARPRFVEQLRNEGGNPCLMVLMWHHSERVAAALVERGVDRFFTFPVSLARLRGKVAEALNGTAR